MKLLQNYFSDIEHIVKYSWAVVSLWNNFEIISDKFLRAEIKLFETDIDEGCNNIISHVTTALCSDVC